MNAARVWVKRQPHEHVPRIARREDQRVHLPAPPRHRVRQQAQVAEVDLALHPRLAIGDPDRRRGLPEPAPLHAEPVQRPVRHHDALPFQQDPDLHHRQARLHLPGDLRLAGLQLIPRPPVPARPHRPDRLSDLADQLIGQLARPAIAGQPGLCRRLHIPAGGLAVHPRLLSDPAQPRPRQPGPQHLTDLSHRNLPERHPPNPQADRLEGIRTGQ